MNLKAQEFIIPADTYLVPFNNHKGLPDKQQKRKKQ